MNAISTIDDLDEALSRPTPGVLETLRMIEGDFILLGAGGKMGPTLARMIRRGLDEIGEPHRRVTAVSRFGSESVAREIERHGVKTIRCDLLDREAVRSLPGAPNVIFMAGQKFGTTDAPELTWVMNTYLPALLAERYAGSRTVVFSTGCVYPLMPISGKGAREDHPLTPPGEYANSCVGRERVFGHFAKQFSTPTLFLRLCYAIDLRYGVLMDVAQKVMSGAPIDVSMGSAHVIWQGDANARAIQSLFHTATPPVALNVTGLERISIRELAERFAKRLDMQANLVGAEGTHAWIWDASQSYEWFGPPAVSLDEMIEATAQWLALGGETMGKPTHFEVQDGQF